MLCRPICNIIQRNIFTNRKIHYELQDTLIANFKRYNLCTNYMHSQNVNLIIPRRFKSKGKFARHNKRDEEEQEEDDEELSLEDDPLYTPKSKIIETNIPSLRLDAVTKAGLGISRAKFDQEFYKSNIRINGRKCLKKSYMVKIGDEIDHIQKESPDNAKLIVVNRCKIISVSVESDTLRAKLIQDKSLLIENYDDPWTGG
ncbi:mitochondrial transcription rescue factor 1 [Megachile rotundata]|uniref:mitochondrial transcription rescue factor 1 n=1 Tax=Megachile rotundata TaxID=143995 RepID=UPI003FD0F08D